MERKRKRRGRGRDGREVYTFLQQMRRKRWKVRIQGLNSQSQKSLH